MLIVVQINSQNGQFKTDNNAKCLQCNEPYHVKRYPIY